MKPRIAKINRSLALATGAAISLLAVTNTPGAEESAHNFDTLNLANECDRLAGSPHDTQRNSTYSAVSINAIDTAAIQPCRLAFEATGNPRFAYQLGRALNKAAEIEEAMIAYGTAVEADYPAAKVNFGMLLGRIGDQKTEFQMYSEAASRGNLLASYNLGVAYRDGLGTEPNIDEALYWFEKAALGGDDTAAFNIAVIYDEGNALPEDNQTAIAWYDLAAARGNVDAMVNLAIMLETGEGIQADLGQAAEMYARAAQKGDAFAANKVLEFYESMAQIKPVPADPSGAVTTLVLKDGDEDLTQVKGPEI